MTKNKQKPKNNGIIKKSLKIVGITFAALLVISAFAGGKADNEVQEQQSEEEQLATGLTQKDAADYCQDYRTLNVKLTGRLKDDVATIYISRYEPLWSEYLGHPYDEEGNPIMMFAWNGKDRGTGESIRFTCVLSGKDKDHIHLHQLRMNTQVINGLEEFPRYDQDGNLLSVE